MQGVTVAPTRVGKQSAVPGPHIRRSGASIFGAHTTNPARVQNSIPSVAEPGSGGSAPGLPKEIFSASDTPEGPPRRRSAGILMSRARFLPQIVACLLALASFYPVLGGEFVGDDLFSMRGRLPQTEAHSVLDAFQPASSEIKWMCRPVGRHSILMAVLISAAGLFWIRSRLGFTSVDFLPPDPGLAFKQILSSVGFYTRKIWFPWPLTPMIPQFPGLAETLAWLAIGLSLSGLSIFAAWRGEYSLITAAAGSTSAPPTRGRPVAGGRCTWRRKAGRPARGTRRPQSRAGW